MKKLLIIATAIMLFFSTTAFTSIPDPVNEEVQTAFLKKFKDAENVSWKKTGELNFAYFLMDATTYFAAYNDEADLVALSRKIDLAQLPLNIVQALKEKYAENELSATVTEMVMNGETSYYLTAENDKRILDLKCRTNGDIEVISKTKK